MFTRSLNHCKTFIAGDKTTLRELLHPNKANLAIRYSLAHAVVKPGESSTAHRLKTSEVYYILQGEGMMYMDDESAHVRVGDAIYVPPHSLQHITNTGKDQLLFLCIVDPAWRKEDEEIL